MAKVLNYVESKWGSFFKAPVGSHPAIIVWVAELGTAMSNYWNNDREQDLVRVFFEIEANVNVAKEWESDKFEDKVFTTEQDYNCVVTNKSKLWKMIAWVYWKQPSEIKWFSLDQLLWKKCVINVVHSDKWFASIDSVSMESKKMNYHEQEKTTFYFGINEKEWDNDLFESFAPFVKERILKSNEAIALWYGTPSLAQQDIDFEKEIAEAKAKSVTTKEVEELFMNEPATTTEARDNVKVTTAPNDFE